MALHYLVFASGDNNLGNVQKKVNESVLTFHECVAAHTLESVLTFHECVAAHTLESV